LGVIAAGCVAEIERRRSRYVAVYLLAIVLSLFLTFGAPAVFGWYVVPVCAVFSLLFAKGVADLSGILSGSGRVVAWGITIAYLMLFAAFLPTTFRGERNIQTLVEDNIRKPIGFYLSQTPITATIAGEPLGYVGYYSQRTFYDYPGLCSRKVVGWLKNHKYPRKFKTLQVFAFLQPDYLVLRRSEYERFVQEPDGQFISDYRVEREFRITPEDRKKLLYPEKNLDLDFLVLAHLAHH
jgi:hypothetical protein